MEDKLLEYRDFALVMAWPDQTARGDEKWMALLKRLGVVKNLNFKVGHAAIVLVNSQTGALAYFDFGRYVTPRGYGRARSAESDPRLALSIRAVFDENGSIANLPAILSELHEMEYATHGGGRLFFSIATGISYTASTRFAQRIVNQGPVKYGAIANGNNSCSRFVAQVLLAGLTATHPARRRISIPESIKPSPMSNVVNASPNWMVYCYHDDLLESRRMTRWRSLCFQVDLLLHNLSAAKARELPCDRKPGSLSEPQKPTHVPQYAHWLGGIGEGAWYTLEQNVENELLVVVRYAHDGAEEYRVNCLATHQVDFSVPYQFTYQCHYQRHVVVQGDKQIILETITHTDTRAKTA